MENVPAIYDTLPDLSIPLELIRLFKVEEPYVVVVVYFDLVIEFIACKGRCVRTPKWNAIKGFRPEELATVLGTLLTKVLIERNDPTSSDYQPEPRSLNTEE